MFKRNRFKRKYRLYEYFSNRDCPMDQFDKSDIRGKRNFHPFLHLGTMTYLGM